MGTTTWRVLFFFGLLWLGPGRAGLGLASLSHGGTGKSGQEWLGSCNGQEWLQHCKKMHEPTLAWHGPLLGLERTKQHAWHGQLQWLAPLV